MRRLGRVGGFRLAAGGGFDLRDRFDAYSVSDSQPPGLLGNDLPSLTVMAPPVSRRISHRLHERHIIDTGEMAYEPLPIAKIYDRGKRNGHHRWYIDFATTCGTVQSRRIDNTNKDNKRGYSRAEHLRQQTRTEGGQGVHARCFGWHEDAESLDNTLDRTQYGDRMTAHSPTRQHAVTIGFALGRNAIAHYLHRRSQKSLRTNRGPFYPQESHLSPTEPAAAHGHHRQHPSTRHQPTSEAPPLTRYSFRHLFTQVPRPRSSGDRARLS